MRLVKTATVIAVASLWLSGCSSSSPTSSNGFQLVIAVALANTALAPTIVEAELLLDGTTANDVLEAAPAAIVSLSATGTAGSGPHTMQVVVLQQTSTPNKYTVSTPTIQVFDVNGNLLKTITLTTQTASLATGGTINYTFSL